jgi:hypothetical protein
MSMFATDDTAIKTRLNVDNISMILFIIPS